jgi:SAM-dependent MidA family methyltransferase
MALCLGHPEHGYYATRDPFGAAGDFVTAPEISQMFGELVGAWAAQAWADAGAPDPVVLAELGPGRGTLMKDALRAAAGMPGFRAAARLWLVETSPVLRARQAEALGAYAPAWAGSLAGLPAGPLVVLANEFFDALPIRQFQRIDALWRERLVGLGDGRLVAVWGAPRGDAELDRRFPQAADGAVVEVSAAGEAAAAALGARIARQGIAALVVDYGAEAGSGDTLQALKRHAPADPLAEPGEADLTAHVGFSALAAAARPARSWGPVPQGAFLERLGITARARALARRGGAAAEAVAAAHRRLTHPEEMGNLLRVLALTPDDAPPPPGFEQ